MKLLENHAKGIAPFFTWLGPPFFEHYTVNGHFSWMTRSKLCCSNVIFSNP